MANPKHIRGFTLVELLITVAILGILAAVAITAYGVYIRRAHNAEATSLLSDVRIKQEAYRATFHRYQNLGQAWIPSGDPGPSTRAWPAPTDATAAIWRQLGVTPNGAVYFSYSGEAGEPGTAPEDSDYSAAEYKNDFWYGAKAVQDLDGNGTCGGFVVISGETRMSELEEAAGNCPD